MTNNNTYKLCNVLFGFVRLQRTLLVRTPEQSPINDYRCFADLVEMCLRWIYFDLLSSSQVNLYTHISY